MSGRSIESVRLLNTRLQDQHAVVGFGDFAHDIGVAGIALGGAYLEGVDQRGETDGTDRDGALTGGGIAGVEAVELDQEALSGTAEVCIATL